MALKVVTTADAPAWEGYPYPQAVVTGQLVYVSGQLGIDESSGEPLDGIEAQTRAVLTYLSAILQAAGSSLDDIVKTTCYLTDRARDYDGFNKVYREFFRNGFPARATVEVSQLAPGYVVEIEAVGQLPG
ncbi:RidA family protein [Amycolatopsis jejuensis]|uniref:RidA family protein n=1 Tax=Amycolatopsis jejuensis TaxID=330084 RepID=UPI0005263EEA|nr:RidA family protein [Amycolatopsis jejuensis]